MTGFLLASSPARLAIIAGVVLGCAYAAAPNLVWFLIVAAGLFAWAGRGLTGRERRAVWTILAVAIGLRVLAVGLLYLTSEPHHIGNFAWEGDGFYFKRRSIWLRNLWTGVPLPPLYFRGAFDLYGGYGWTTLLYVAGFLQYLGGPSPYGFHLVNVTVFVAAAILLFRLTRASYGPEAALVGLGLVLFMPTLFAWSVSSLKEPPVVFLIAAIIVATVKVVRGAGPGRRAAAFVVLAALVASIDGVKSGALIIALGGLAIGLSVAFIVRRPRFWPVVPVVLAAALWVVATSPEVQDRVMTQVRRGAGLHIGHARERGYGYKLLDQRFYSAPRTGDVFETMTPPEATRFTIRALASVVAFPLPTQAQSRAQLAFLPQQMVWYVLLLLAVVGLGAGLRRDPLLTCLLAGVVVVGGAGVALAASGNFGTMVRQRDVVVPFVLWLSALGAVATVATLSARRRRPESEA